MNAFAFILIYMQETFWYVPEAQGESTVCTHI